MTHSEEAVAESQVLGHGKAAQWKLYITLLVSETESLRTTQQSWWQRDVHLGKGEAVRWKLCLMILDSGTKTL